MGKVEHICISESKGERKTPVESAVMCAGSGIESDAHCGSWHRQVSILAAEDIATVRENLPDIKPGDFAENLIVSRCDLASLGLGSLLRIGSDVILRVSQIGKVCHTPCRIYHLTGDCIMPKLGLFARVLEGGPVNVGDDVEIIETVSRDAFQAVVLTISDRCSRGEATDTAGPATAKLLGESLRANIYAAEIIPDECETIAERMKHYCDGHSIDLVLAVGGTGFSPRDVTPEATRQVIERATPGLDEAMRTASLTKTPHAMLSRAVSGIRGATLIVNLPGSLRASVENLEAILPALGHGLKKLRGDPDDCGRPPQEQKIEN